MTARSGSGGPQSEALAGLTTGEMAEIGEWIEAHVMDELVQAMAPEAVARYGVRLERIGSATALTFREADVPMLNRVVGLGLREPLSEATLDEALEVWRDATVRFMIQVSPAALTDELHARLEARGLSRKDNWAKMIRGLEPPPDVRTDLRIEQVGAEHARAFTDIVCAAFEMPPEYEAILSGLVGRAGWQHYLAFDGERPVAAGALCVRGEVGNLTFGATLASHRGRGAQGAIMARRIRDAAALGCRWLVTETGEDVPEHPNPSYRNMLRTGFQLAYLRPNYIYFPDQTSR